MPIFRLEAGSLVTSLLPIMTVPPSSTSSPARARSAVVLPQPEGPRSTTSSPGEALRFIDLRAATSL